MASGNPFASVSRAAKALAREFVLISNFKTGYRNREDITVLPPGVMVEGSQNVLTNTFERVGIRKGFTLDGQADTSLAPIAGGGPAMGVFDWNASNGNGERNMRAGFLTSAGNDGKLQFRYVDSSGNVTWTDLLTGLTSVNFNYITFWDADTLQTIMLCVNGENNIRSWSGALAETSAATNATGIIDATLNPNNITNANTGSFSSGGVDYVVGDLLALPGGNADAVMEVDSIVAGGVKTVTIGSGGSGYAVNDYVRINYPSGGPILSITAITSGGSDYSIGDTVTTGSGGAVLEITGVLSGGVVQSMRVVEGGSGYSSATSQATSAISPPTGGGSGLTISYNAASGIALLKVTSVSGGVVTGLSIVANGLSYTVSSSNATTGVSTGGSPSGLTVNITAIGNTINSWHLTNNGSGYLVSPSLAPTVTTGGSGTGASIWISIVATGRVKVSGTKTLSQLGFAGELTPTDGSNLFSGGTFVVAGVSYTYTSLGDNGFSFISVTPDPSVIPNGSVVIASMITWTNGTGISGISVDEKNDLIGTLNARVFVGSLSSSYVYLSNYANYKIYNDALTLILTNPPTAFVPQEQAMYISAGKEEWYKVDFVVSADLTNASVEIKRLNTTAQQASQSQAATTKIANNIACLSFEPYIETFGPVENILLGPQMTDLSYPIVNLMNNYDFTGAALAYYRKFLYIAVPREGIVLIYNMTNNTNPYWEAPQVMSISRFSIIEGELYGHSSQVSETYKLFTGTNDNGEPILATAKFSFNHYGTRAQSKGYNEFYVEGYISPNTELTIGIQFDIDGCATNTSYLIHGDDTQIVCISKDMASLGKVSLGKNPLGGQLGATSNTPKFRMVKTFLTTYFYEDQISFSSSGIDQQWDILAFGPALIPGGSLNNNITQ